MSIIKKNKKINIKLNTTKAIFGSFLSAILVGSFVLMLPISSNSHTPTNLLTCIFTATSSICVTGLVIVDTATHWSFFGQLVILILIQFGGLGIIVVATITVIFLGQKINLIQRATLQEALSANKIGGIIKLTKFIIRGVLTIEFLGAIILFIKFIQEMSFAKAIWYSIFHSVSAFCNAGFDLMGIKEQFSSLIYYQSSIIVNIVIMILIITGGIGFTVWANILKKKNNVKKYSLQTKIVLITTLLLILLPAMYFYVFEYSNLSGITKVLSSLFQSVTTRTAGFNTTDFSKMSEVGQAISIILMLVGGSPGSTAGGMKTTTFAVLIISTVAVFKKENEAHIFDRRIEVQIVKNAITIFILYLSVFLFSSFVICKIESTPLLATCFETASAIGTVGLSQGITPNSTSITKIILIILMYLGRVGGLTFIYAIMPNARKSAGYIKEDINVG